MKALSFYQPFAWLLANSYLIEDQRHWWCSYKGPLIIHASKRIYQDIYDQVKCVFPIPEKNLLEYGGIVAVTEMIGIEKRNNSYFFKFENTKKVEFLNYRGKPGLFEIEDDVVQKLVYIKK